MILINFTKRLKKRLKQIYSVVLLPKALKKVHLLYAYKKSVGGRVSIIILYEHIGDIIACEPVSRYLKSHNTKVVWVINEKFKDLLSLFQSVDMILPVSSIAEIIYIKAFLRESDIYNLHFDGRPCFRYDLHLHNKNREYSPQNYFNYGSILETFSQVAGLPRLKECPRLCLQSEDRFSEIKSGFVSIQVDSNESCKMWDFEKWEKLIQMNPNLIFVEIGLKPHFSHLSNCFTSYCGKLSLSDIAYMMRKSRLFIGIDSSGAHYANALNIPSIILLGSYHEFSQYNPYAVTSSSFKILYRLNVNDISVDEVQREMSELTQN